MTLRNRAILIILGALIFLTAGPIIVLAARGYYYDFDARVLVKTGTLTVKTDPRGAAVFLDGENRGDTPFVKRFVSPGEHRVELAKPGYFSWEKKLTVQAGQVAVLPAGTDRIFLLQGEPRELFRAATTTGMAAMPEDTAAERYYIATGTQKLLRRTGTNADEDETVADNLPKFVTSKILVSSDRQVFLLLDKTLYQVGETLIKVNDRVSYAKWTHGGGALIYGSDHEIWLYRPEAARPNELITRLANPIGQAEFHPGIGYFFWSSQGKITALEYDPVFTPNIYTLAETKKEQVPLSLNPAGTELTYYDSGELVTVKIR